MKKLAPSILSADFTCLGKEIGAVAKAGADYIHIDVMDGHFVPNITVGSFVVKAVKRVTELPLDVHLMIEQPEKYIKAFADAGADIITVHAEACRHLHGAMQLIKESGVRAGVSLNPSTPLDAIEWVIGDIDLLLIMSVNPGFGGQSFINRSIEKVKIARRFLDAAGSKAELEIDGGIKISNIAEVSMAGADVFVAGSAIFGSNDYEKTIISMRRKLAE